MDIESQLADGLTKREQAKLDKHIKDIPLKLNELKKLFKENE